MRKIEFNVYSFAELSEIAKEKAIANYIESQQNNDCLLDSYFEFFRDTFGKLQEFFDIKHGASYWFIYNSSNIYLEEMTVSRFISWLQNNIMCNFKDIDTYMDYVVIDAYGEFIKYCKQYKFKREDPCSVFCDILRRKFRDQEQSEYDYLTSREYAIDSLSNNYIEFTEDGSVFQ